MYRPRYQGNIMIDRPWLTSYPDGVPADIDPQAYAGPGVSAATLLERCFSQYAARCACVYMGHETTYAQVEQQSRAMAAYFQSLGLQRGDRVALMMPNVPQYLVAVIAVLRAGLVVVNVNPLYTPRELSHQLRDSGASTIVVLENFASTLQQCEHETPVKHVVLAALGDSLGWLKATVVNAVVRHVKKMVPAFALKASVVRFNTALARGARAPWQPPELSSQDLALLQYTGGTTGVSKGVMLTHGNVVANLLQSQAWYQPTLRQVPPGEAVTAVCALPLYHVFSFTINMMLHFSVGGGLILLPNPRDLPAMFKALKGRKFHLFAAVNPLFLAIAKHPLAPTVDWSSLKLAMGGGTPTMAATARAWQALTGRVICDAYGLSETAPSAICNPTDTTVFSGTIGLPLPSTEVKLLDEAGQLVPPGTPGEICIRGPQVMAGYWQRPDETALVLMADGFLRTGDIGLMDERGQFTIVDRKKDMILVSGFNVYPTEVEDIITQLDGVLECAVIGEPDERSGEAVKAFVVRSKPTLTENDVHAHCVKNLAGYKRPRFIEFRDALPKTPVGKVLRRELRSA